MFWPKRVHLGCTDRKMRDKRIRGVKRGGFSHATTAARRCPTRIFTDKMQRNDSNCGLVSRTRCAGGEKLERLYYECNQINTKDMKGAAGLKEGSVQVRKCEK